jgi:hypothetical protein
VRSRFQFVDDHRDAFEVKRLCEVLDLNRSGEVHVHPAAPTALRV